MAKQLKRFLSFCLVCIMSLNVLIIRPMAAQYADDYSVKTVEISNSIYDLYVTNNRTGQVDALRVTKNGDGTCSSQGWFDIGNSNTYQITESDFRVIADKNQILYQDKNGTNKVLGAFSSGKCNEMLSSPSVLRVTYGHRCYLYAEAVVTMLKMRKFFIDAPDPWREESRDWIRNQRNEFIPMLETQKRVNSGELSSDALLAYSSLQHKYSVYQRVVQSNINYYLKENPGAWLVYETGYKKLFGFTGTGDVQDTLLAGLLCALCFSGLFAMERKGGMDEILACTPLGRKYTVKAKLRQSIAVAAVISFVTVLPHLWQVLRDYGLPSLLGPAMSISDLQAVPKFITLSDLLIFWLICRFAACLCMSRITLWLGQKLGNLLTALFISAVAYCLPALLSLSGMKNGIEWLGFYPLFHAAALWQNKGYNANGESYNAMWIPIFLVCAAFFLAWAIGQALIDDYDMIGVPDEVL